MTRINSIDLSFGIKPAIERQIRGWGHIKGLLLT
jgi:hypothetical protein